MSGTDRACDATTRSWPEVQSGRYAVDIEGLGRSLIQYLGAAVSHGMSILVLVYVPEYLNTEVCLGPWYLSTVVCLGPEYLSAAVLSISVLQFACAGTAPCPLALLCCYASSPYTHSAIVALVREGTQPPLVLPRRYAMSGTDIACAFGTHALRDVRY
eukprot:2330352-Rhodomonas_salina.5